MRAKARRRLDRSPIPAPEGRARAVVTRRAFGTPSSESTLARAQRLGHRVDRLSNRSGEVAIQRTFDPDGLPKTETADYIVGKGGSVLYGWYLAAPPVPSTLYTRRDEKTTRGTKYYEWKPNVRLLGKDEKDNESLDVDSLTRAVEQPTGRPGDVLPKLGMVGVNDCGKFANALQAMIRDSGEADSGIRKTRQIESLRQEKDEIVVAVGDMMKHFYQSGYCNHHAATIVAKDGGDVVTLEGHVSKDLQAPEFHVRRGLAGFVEDNKQSTDKVNVEPVRANKDVDAIFDNYELLKDPKRDTMTKLYTLNNALAATRRVKGQIRQAKSSSVVPWLFAGAVVVVGIAWLLGAFG